MYLHCVTGVCVFFCVIAIERRWLPIQVEVSFCAHYKRFFVCHNYRHRQTRATYAHDFYHKNLYSLFTPSPFEGDEASHCTIQKCIHTKHL